MAVDVVSRSSLPPPPVVEGFPLLGNALELADDVLQFLLKQYRKHGPIFRFNALNQSYTVMAGVEANLFFSQHGHTYFRSDTVWGAQNAEYGAQRSMIDMDGPDHTRMRKVQGPSYSRALANGHFPTIVSIAQREAQSWGKPVPVVLAMQRIITEQIGLITTGFSPREYLDDLIVMLRTVLMVHITQQRPALLLRNPKYQRAKARVLAFAQEVLDAHRRHPERYSTDLINDLVNLANEDPALLPESDILLASLGPFIAGIDTAANTCAFMLYALLKNPVLRDRAIAEADALFADGIPTPDQLRKSDVLHRVCLETLRRYPIAPAVRRRVAEDFAFAGHLVKANTEVMIATTLPHFLPELYPNPQRFDIDRYLPERKEHKQRGAFAPYGLGAHTCLGAGMAEVLIMLSIATVLHTTRLQMEAPYDLKIVPAPTQKPDNNFRVRMVEQRHTVV